LAVACRKVSRRARVAWCKRNIVLNKWTRAKAERGIWRVRMLRGKIRMHPKGRKGVKDLGGGRPRCLRIRDLKKLRLESTGNLDTTFRKTMRLEITRRIAKSTVGLQKIKGWTLWRGQPPPKQKKRLHME
jgi:hypothetical protein